MSVSKSKRRSMIQGGVPCDFCKEEVINWFCRDCVKLICETCTCEHLKSEESQDHEILSTEELKRNISRSVEVKRGDREKIKENIQRLLDEQTDYVDKMDACISDVKREVNKLVECARVYEKKMVDEIANMRDSNLKVYEKLRDLLHESDQTYEQTISEIDTQLQIMSGEEIGEFMKAAEQIIGSLSVPKLEENVNCLSLIEDGDRNGIIKKCIGSLAHSTLPVRIGIEAGKDFVDAGSPKPRAELEVLSKFEPSWGEAVWSVSVARDGKAWVGSGDKTLRLMDKSGREYKKVWMDFTPLHTKTNPDDDVIVTHALKTTKIHRVTPEGRVSVYADITPFNAFGVYVTEGGNILACTTNRKLMKFFHNGEVSQNIELEIDPYQITVTNRGRYLVRGGDLLLTVHSLAEPIQLQPEWKIDPVECDRYGNIVCGSRKTGGGIYLLNQYGLLLQQYPLNDHVLDLAVDDDDQLWIATRSGKVIVANYLERPHRISDV